eukprot:gene9847-2170_t
MRKFETNNAQLIEYSPITEQENRISIPSKLYEQFFVDYFEVKNFLVKIEENTVILFKKENFILDNDKNKTIYSLEHVYYRMISEYFSDVWYPEIESLTFKSVFIDFTENEIDLLIEFTSISDSGYDSLKKKINKEIKKFNGKVFARLNSVSPKSKNEMTNADEVLETFLNSGRIHNSLIESKKFFEKSNLMLREFIDNFPVEMEFRCFVLDLKMTAISQYDTKFVKHFQTKHQQEKLKNKILNFYKKNLDLIPYTDFTMDIVFMNEDDIKIIEFGGFGIEQNVGGCLYNWYQDYHILYNTSSETDIRVFDKEYSFY